MKLIEDATRKSLLEETREAFNQLRQQYLPPRVYRAPYNWALEERFIGQGASPLTQEGTIKYQDVFPWCREPSNTAVDMTVQVTVLMMASAMGKTDGIVSNIIGWGVHEKPTNILTAYPNENARDKYVRDVVEKGLINATPVLRRLIGKEGNLRDQNNSIAYKSFPGGSMNIVASGSVSNFRGPRAGIAYAGEVDGMPGSVGVEGDPVALLFKRCEGFEDAVKIVEGTPSIKGKSRIEFWYNLSDKRNWFVPCRNCGTEQVLRWTEHVFWPGNEWEKARIVCAHCGEEHDDRQRVAMVEAGRWKPTAPFSGVRGYWINGINSLLPAEKGFKHKLHQFAVDAHRAAHSQTPRETRKVWVNTFLAETWEDDRNPRPSWRGLYDRREEYTEGSMPNEVIILTAGMDIQDDRVEVEVIGWAPGEESWGIEHAVFEGDPRTPEIYQRVEAFLIKPRRRVDGAVLQVKAIGCDTGNARCVRQTYAWLRPRFFRGFYAMKGGNKKDAEPVSVKARSKVDRLTLYHIGTNAIKTLIYDRSTISVPTDLERPPDGIPGFMHFPTSYKEEWFKQLLMEDSRTETVTDGREIRVFEKPKIKREDSSANNEALDMRVYAQAALYLKGNINWTWQEGRNKKTIQEGKAAKKFAATKPQPQKQTRRQYTLRQSISAW